MSDKEETPVVVIDPRTTKVNLSILGSIIGASFLAWAQVSNLEQGLTGVRGDVRALSANVKEVKTTLERQGDHLRSAAMQSIRLETRVQSLEKRNAALEARVRELERAK